MANRAPCYKRAGTPQTKTGAARSNAARTAAAPAGCCANTLRRKSDRTLARAKGPAAKPLPAAMPRKEPPPEDET
eukprot:10035344-Lingulodinium_polyedra.AAC.1